MTVFWGVVNNAGILTPRGPVEFATRQDYVKLMTVNFLGMVEVTATFLPLLKKSKGRIVNMSSVSGFIALNGFGAYTSSKHAVLGYTDILRYI